MKIHFTSRQLLVLGTASVALFTAGSGAAYSLLAMPAPVKLEFSSSPCVGKQDAPIEIVLFEDFRCSTCRTFNQTILPEIETRYISSGKVKFTIVPLAFIRGSKPMANAALAVYKQAPDRFIPYIHELFKTHSVLENGELLEIADRVGGIDLLKLQACLTTHCYYPELDRNLEVAKEIMGRDFGTPALYVNGIPTSTASFDAVQARVDKLTRKD